jgi:hypothetical protein
MPNPDETRRPASYLQKIGRLRLFSAVAALAILIVLAGVYGIAHRRSNPADAACQAAVNTAKRIAPLVRGEVAAFTPAHTPLRVPDLAFKDAKGRDVALADWRLQTLLGGADFQVVAVNIDTRDPQKPLTFLKDVGITHLAYFSDPSARVFEELKTAGKAFGMPTTIILDPSGCEIGNMAGPAEWASDDGVRLVGAAIRKPG